MLEHSRLQMLEENVGELSNRWDEVRADLGRLDTKIDAVGMALSARMTDLDQKFDCRLEAVDRRFDAMEQRIDRRFEAIGRRFEAIDRRFVELRGELAKQFRWTFSTMLALLGMVLTVGAGVATALLRQ
jgi:hypothetical protein